MFIQTWSEVGAGWKLGLHHLLTWSEDGARLVVGRLGRLEDGAQHIQSRAEFSHHTTLYTATNIAFNALHALIFISTVLTKNIQSNYNVDSNMKSSNYMKIQFKALIYFELEQTSN